MKMHILSEDQYSRAPNMMVKLVRALNASLEHEPDLVRGMLVKHRTTFGDPLTPGEIDVVAWLNGLFEDFVIITVMASSGDLPERFEIGYVAYGGQ